MVHGPGGAARPDRDAQDAASRRVARAAGLSCAQAVPGAVFMIGCKTQLGSVSLEPYGDDHCPVDQA